MTEEVQITKSDLTRIHPAARCRGCGVVTWKASLSQGQMKIDARHRAGCAKPPGRLDLLERVPLRRRKTLFGGRLLRSLSDEEVADIAGKIDEHLAERG